MGFLLIGLGLLGVISIVSFILYVDGETVIDAIVSSVCIVGLIAVGITSVALFLIGLIYVGQGLF